MFEKSTITNITFPQKVAYVSGASMMAMFRDMDTTTLNLRTFDTSNVSSMIDLFYRCKVSNLDLSSFDTSNVTNMSYMFRDTINLQTIDLSSFDTSNVTSMSSMFADSAATTGYARTQIDADRFNGTAMLTNGLASDTYKPSTLTFVVKP